MKRKYFHLRWLPESGQYSTWIKLPPLSKSCCLPSTEWSFTVDTEISINSSHSGTDGTSIIVKVCQTARTLSAFTEFSWLSAFFHTVYENWSVFTVARWIQHLPPCSTIQGHFERFWIKIKERLLFKVMPFQPLTPNFYRAQSEEKTKHLSMCSEYNTCSDKV